jgi:hypothetical protein
VARRCCHARPALPLLLSTPSSAARRCCRARCCCPPRSPCWLPLVASAPCLPPAAVAHLALACSYDERQTLLAPPEVRV